MVRFCEENEIPFDRCGKVIIATRKDELPRLRALLERGTQNQVEGLQLVSGEQVRAEIEPHVNVIEALWAPNTGIVDYPEGLRRVRAAIHGIWAARSSSTRSSKAW